MSRELFIGLDDRFWSKVEKTATCWLWTSAVDEKGYPLYWQDGACRRLRVLVVCPDDLQVSHLCKVKRCVRPDHIVFETPGENKRRDPGPGRPRPCPNGHPLSSRTDRGGEECADCRRQRARERYAAKVG